MQNRVLVQRNMPLLCETLYRVHADVSPPSFVGTLHLIHYPLPATEIVESGSIQKDHSRACCSTELSVNWAQHQDPCIKKIHNFSWLLCSGFYKDYHYQHHQHPRVSVSPSVLYLFHQSESLETPLVVSSLCKTDEYTLMWTDCHFFSNLALHDHPNSRMHQEIL